MLPHGTRSAASPARDDRDEVRGDARRPPTARETCQIGSRSEREEDEGADHRRDVGEQRHVERVVRDASPLQVGHGVCTSLDRSGSRSSGAGRGADAPPAADAIASTSRANSSSNCGLRCSANPPTAHRRPVAVGIGAHPDLAPGAVERGQQSHEDEDSRGQHEGHPGVARSPGTPSTAGVRGTRSWSPTPSSPSASGRAVGEVGGALGADDARRDLVAARVESSRFVARSLSTPSQTVKRMIGSNSTEHRLAASLAGSSSAANARLSGHSSSSIARSTPPAPAPGASRCRATASRTRRRPRAQGRDPSPRGPTRRTSPSTVTCDHRRPPEARLVDPEPLDPGRVVHPDRLARAAADPSGSSRSTSETKSIGWPVLAKSLRKSRQVADRRP